MQHDEMIWQVINHQFCSYKTTIGKALSDKTHFCKHPYSVTGLCNRTSCPLANSLYATLREENGRINLYMKTVERAHTPKNLWEKIKLSRNYAKALTQIDEHLQYFPKAIIHRNKQRLTKIHQYLLRMRKIELKIRSGRHAKQVGIHRKIEQREERREKKALIASRLETHIEHELIDRLAKGTYGDIYNFPETSYQKALAKHEEKEDAEAEAEEESIAESEEDDETNGVVEYVEDFESDEEDDQEEEEIEELDYIGDNQWGVNEGDDSDKDDGDSDVDSDDDSNDKPLKMKKTEHGDDAKSEKKYGTSQRRRPRLQIEYEDEHEDNDAEAIVADSAW